VPKKTFLRLDEEKRERVVRAAINEFHENGFEKAKIETIADKAGVAKGSIYQYFENKKDLFLYSVTWSMEYFMKIIDTHTPLKEMDVFDYLLKDTRHLSDLAKRERTMLLFYQDIYSGKFGELAESINEELWKIGDEYILRLIAVGKNKGTIRTDSDDQLLLLFYKGVTTQLKEHIFGKLRKNEFEVSESMYEEVEQTMQKMLLLLKEGMGC